MAGILNGKYIQSEIDVEYEFERFDNNRDEQTKYHQAVCDSDRSPRKSPIKQNNNGDLFNIENNTAAQPDDSAIGAATAAVSTVPDSTVITATKADVGAKPNSTTTITATPPMMTLEGVTSSISTTTNKKKTTNIGFQFCKGSLGPSVRQHTTGQHW